MTFNRRTIGMVKATHFGPTVLGVSISFILATTQLSFPKSFEIALAILAGQCVVGWTNELVDQSRDSEAGRIKKPLVAGSVTPKQLQIGIAIALGLAVLLSSAPSVPKVAGFICWDCSAQPFITSGLNQPGSRLCLTRFLSELCRGLFIRLLPRIHPVGFIWTSQSSRWHFTL